MYEGIDIVWSTSSLVRIHGEIFMHTLFFIHLLLLDIDVFIRWNQMTAEKTKT